MAKKAKAKVKTTRKPLHLKWEPRLPNEVIENMGPDHPIKPYFASEIPWSKALPSRSSFIVERVRVNKAETYKSFAIANDDIRISWGEGFVNDEFRRMNPTMVRFKMFPNRLGEWRRRKRLRLPRRKSPKGLLRRIQGSMIYLKQCECLNR